MADSNTVRAAVEISEEAGRILSGYFRRGHVATRSKGDRDVVTEADTASERYLLSELRGRFPRDGVVAEEGGRVPSTNGCCWYVDPLDGTMNFARGIPIWCVSVGRLNHEQPDLGVIHDPTRGETFAAERGTGSRCNGRPMRCSEAEDIRDAFVHVTVDFETPSMAAGLDDLRSIAPRALRTRNLGSAALALAYVAAGRFEAMLHRSANAWDYAAGVALTLESGGVVTDFHGKPYTSATTAVVAACSERLHGQLLACLGRAAG
ncbi:MAG TPA: inositol monophosphatase [Chloroflexota bacterium]|nr:inositol monophosphatase [Chloroflexota bacterium]